MTDEQRKECIESYVQAYNDMDVAGMLKQLHPEIDFAYYSDDEITGQAKGIDEFKRLAELAIRLFSARELTIDAMRFGAPVTTIDVSYRGTLAMDLPDGMKTGDTFELQGRSEFEFKDGKIIKLSDYS